MHHMTDETDEISRRRRYLLEQLSMLRRRHEQECKPLIDELVRLERFDIRPMLVDLATGQFIRLLEPEEIVAEAAKRRASTQVFTAPLG